MVKNKSWRRTLTVASIVFSVMLVALSMFPASSVYAKGPGKGKAHKQTVSAHVSGKAAATASFGAHANGKAAATARVSAEATLKQGKDLELGLVKNGKSDNDLESRTTVRVKANVGDRDRDADDQPNRPVMIATVPEDEEGQSSQISVSQSTVKSADRDGDNDDMAVSSGQQKDADDVATAGSMPGKDLELGQAKNGKSDNDLDNRSTVQVQVNVSDRDKDSDDMAVSAGLQKDTDDQVQLKDTDDENVSASGQVKISNDRDNDRDDMAQAQGKTGQVQFRQMTYAQWLAFLSARLHISQEELQELIAARFNGMTQAQIMAQFNLLFANQLQASTSTNNRTSTGSNSQTSTTTNNQVSTSANNQVSTSTNNRASTSATTSANNRTSTTANNQTSTGVNNSTSSNGGVGGASAPATLPTTGGDTTSPIVLGLGALLIALGLAGLKLSRSRS